VGRPHRVFGDRTLPEVFNEDTGVQAQQRPDAPLPGAGARGSAALHAKEAAGPLAVSRRMGGRRRPDSAGARGLPEVRTRDGVLVHRDQADDGDQHLRPRLAAAPEERGNEARVHPGLRRCGGGV